MLKSEPSSSSENTASAEVSEDNDLVKKLKTKFPVLKDIIVENMEIIELAKLIEEMSKEIYEPDKKYKLGYNIIEIGNLIEGMKNKIETTKSDLDGINSLTDINTLSEKQQKAIFILYRNIIADGFHGIYEDSIKVVLEGFINNVCQGKFEPKTPVFQIDSIKKNLEKNAMPNFFKTDKTVKLEKIYHQIVYFLKKAEDFIKNETYDEGIMALIAAGSCARGVNLSKQNPIKTNSAMKILTDLRQRYAHGYSQGYSKELIIEEVKKLVLSNTSTSIDTLINKVVTENKNITIDQKSITNYSKKTSVSASTSSNIEESPRAFSFRL